MPHLHLPSRWLSRGAATAVLVVMGLGAQAIAAGPGPAGRWQGEARIPGAPMPVVLDLVLDQAPGSAQRWAGSITLPGRGVKGAVLETVSVSTNGEVQANVGAAFGGPPMQQPTRITLRPAAGGRLEGEWQQAGHRAMLVLRRSGEAQVDSPPPRTPLPPALAGVWRGRYELGGYPREVTLTLAPPATAEAPAGELLIVGKRRTQLAIDRVAASERFVVLESSAAGIRLEGQWSGEAGTFDGLFFQGPFEAPLRLQREAVTIHTTSGSGS